MNLITRCPGCQTLFRVVPDQLRISGGWVRCGQCEEVFDASLHLLAPAAQGTLPDIDSGPDPARPETLNNPVPLESTQMPPDPAVRATLDEAPEPEPDNVAETNNVTFIRTDPDNSYWHKPPIRLLLSFLSLGLLLALAGQVVVHERDRIAALQPKLTPWLETLCRPLNCRLSALKERNSIIIDGASFARIAGDSYQLTFTIKNISNLTLAAPAIEMTLTDSQDQPVLRRVFLPSELDPKSDTLAANSEWGTSAAMSVNLASAAQQVVGYRLYAFYP